MWRSGWSILESFVPPSLPFVARETRSLCGGGRRYGSLWNPHSLLLRGFVCLLLVFFPCAFSSAAWEPYLGSSHQQSVSSFPLPLICASYVEARWFSSVRSVHVSSLVTCFLLRLSGVFLLVDLPKVGKGLEFALGFSWDLMMVFRLDQCLDPQVSNLYVLFFLLPAFPPFHLKFYRWFWVVPPSYLVHFEAGWKWVYDAVVLLWLFPRWDSGSWPRFRSDPSFIRDS